MKNQFAKVGLLTVAALVLMGIRPALPASTPDFDFYKGKIVTYIVATKPGGGYDTYARLIAKYLQKHLPGSTVIVKNIPGAGHIIGANETFTAKPDGLTIGTFNTGLIYSEIAGLPGIRFKIAEFDWVGKASSESRVIVVTTKSPYLSIKDMAASKSEIKMASAGVGSASNNETQILAQALGVPMKPIPGYNGREGEMAMMRGEVAGQVGSYMGLHSFIQSKECRVLLQIATKKHKEMPNIPLASELALSAQGKKLVTLIAATADLGRLTAAPPNTNPARLEALRIAYKKALTDPELLQQAQKQLLDIDPDFGEEVASLVKDALNQPPDNMALLKKLIEVEK